MIQPISSSIQSANGIVPEQSGKAKPSMMNRLMAATHLNNEFGETVVTVAGAALAGFAAYYGGQALISSLQNWNPQDINPKDTSSMHPGSDPVTPEAENPTPVDVPAAETQIEQEIVVVTAEAQTGEEIVVVTAETQAGEEIVVVTAETQTTQKTVTHKAVPNEIPTLVAGTQAAKDAANGTAVAYLDSASATSKTYIVFEEAEAEATRPIQQWAALGNVGQTCPAGLTPKVRIVVPIEVNVDSSPMGSSVNGTNTSVPAAPKVEVPSVPEKGAGETNPAGTTPTPQTKSETGSTPSPEAKPAKGFEKPTPTQTGPTPKPEPKNNQVSNQISWPVAIAEGVVAVVAIPLGIIYLVGSLNE